MARDLNTETATIADVRAQVVVSEVLAMLRSNDRFRDPRIAELTGHDAEHGSELANSLLTYLEAFGDVRSASERLHIHPNTLRYRVRRASEVSGIDFGDSTERLSAQLQLMLARRVVREHRSRGH